MKTEISVSYGAYEIVKRYAGIRFLLPGDEGIYFTPKKQIVIEKGRKVYNPSFAIRYGNNLAGSAIGRDWMVRNNMRIICPAAGSRKYDGYAPLLV